jgi:hypothetical protein
MSELLLWISASILWVLVALQVADYRKRKAVSAELQKLIELIKGEQK